METDTVRIRTTLPKALRLRIFPGPLPDTFDVELIAPITDAKNVATFFADVANQFEKATGHH